MVNTAAEVGIYVEIQFISIKKGVGLATYSLIFSPFLTLNISL